MKYKIIVDKQSRTNPSTEKKQYEVDIEELRCKDDVYDSLVITKDEAYVMRRLSLSELHVLSVLDKEVKEPLGDLHIELFEGDNYIYLLDMTGNKFYAEYLIKNDFNDIYVTTNEMNSAINQSAQQIELTLNQKLTGYSTTEEVQSLIDIKLNEIKIEVNNTYATKTNLENATKTLSASLELKIDKNKLISEINASADVISLESGRLLITSGNFKLDDNGNITCIGGTIGGFALDATKFSTTIDGIYDYNIYDARIALCADAELINVSTIMSNLYDIDGNGEFNTVDAQKILQILSGNQVNNKKVTGTFQINSSDPKNFISIKSGGTLAVSIGVGGINSHLISAESIICGTGNSPNVSINGQDGLINTKGSIFAEGSISGLEIVNRSLESIKKNITKFGDAIEIIKNSEIYEYNFKIEKDEDKKHVGFVIGDKYKTPAIVKSNDGKAIESYSMSAIEWRALQQLIEKVEKLYEKMEV